MLKLIKANKNEIKANKVLEWKMVHRFIHLTNFFSQWLRYTQVLKRLKWMRTMTTGSKIDYILSIITTSNKDYIFIDQHAFSCIIIGLPCVLSALNCFKPPLVSKSWLRSLNCNIEICLSLRTCIGKSKIQYDNFDN